MITSELNKKCGYVCMFRSFLNWEWYKDANTYRLFTHCIFKANYTSKKWAGIEIQRGQFVTSTLKLSEELNISRQSIRTSLKRLISTNELTIKTTKQYTIITVNQYDFYNDINQQTNQQLTNDQPTTNQQLTITNKENKEKHNKQDKLVSNLSTFSFSDENKKDCVKEEQKQQNNDVVSFSDFESTPAEWNTPRTSPKEYQVRVFTQEEENKFYKEIGIIFPDIAVDYYNDILLMIIEELEEQKAKDKYTDKDDAETLLRFIRQKKKPEQKQRFMREFAKRYPEYNPNNETVTLF